MNRDARKDLFEAVGLVAIVASLIFLGIETMQNTNAMYAQSRQSVLDSAQNELLAVMDDPELLMLGFKEGPLTPQENIRLDAFLSAVIRAREFAWLQYRDGVIDGAQWATELAVTRWAFDSPRSRHWWYVVGKSVTGPGFGEFVDSEILSQSLSPEGWRLASEWANR